MRNDSRNSFGFINYIRNCKTISVVVLIGTMAAVLCAVFVISVVDSDENKEKDIETAQSTATAVEPLETTQAPTNNENDGRADEKEIHVTDNYFYHLPDGYEEIEADFGDRFVNQKRFVSEDGVYQIRSFSDVQENIPFPEVVEAIYEGKNAEIDYTEDFIFDDTLIRVRHSEKDEKSGELFYFTTFLWMDRTDQLCWLEVFSPKKEHDELAEELAASIGVDNASSYYSVPEPTPDYDPDPSKEEVDKAMAEDARQRMQEEYEKEMRNELGRMPLKY